MLRGAQDEFHFETPAWTMLHINDLTYRIDGRPILEGATAAIPSGKKVGLVGRNGAGKSTLLRLIRGEIAPDDGAISKQPRARLGSVAQEAPAGPESLLETVLAADKERADLLAEAETASDPHRIAEIHTRLADMGAHAAPARAAEILAGLGFSDEAQSRPCASFSGGWRMRVALAAALFTAPDLLLLDEPTNYLDLEGVLWLETYLSNYPYTVLLVSHDRDLLNGVADQILHLEQRRLFSYQGNYDRFERTRRERIEHQLALKAKQDDARRRMTEFVERFRAKATKARQAQSRLKALEKMEPIPDVVEERLRPFHLPNPRPMASPIIRLEEAEAGYEPGRPVLRALSLSLNNDDRIALLGANGNGKSTFAKLLADRLRPMDGRVKRHKKLKVGYFAQHQLDELNAKDTPYAVFERLMPEATMAERRARLGLHGFGAELADTETGKLSGGEKARLMLALASFEGPHLLILDEPTNHLDVAARSALIEAINAYDGAVLLISHDRHLVETCADRLWLVAEGTVGPFDGDIDAYRAQHLERLRKARKAENAARGSQSAGDGAASQKARRQAAAEARARLAPFKRAAEKAEAEHARLQAELEKLERILADPALFEKDREKALALSKTRAALAGDLEAAEEAWLAALETLEAEEQERLPTGA